MTALNDETRMTAHRLLDVVSVHQDERGANPAAVLTAAGEIGAAEDQDGNTWLQGSLLPASLLLLGPGPQARRGGR